MNERELLQHETCSARKAAGAGARSSAGVPACRAAAAAAVAVAAAAAAQSLQLSLFLRRGDGGPDAEAGGGTLELERSWLFCLDGHRRSARACCVRACMHSDSLFCVDGQRRGAAGSRASTDIGTVCACVGVRARA